MKKSFSLLITGLVFILILSACKDEDDDLNELEEEALNDSTDVTLDFRHTQMEDWGETTKKHIEDVVGQVEDDYENVDIELDGVDPQEAMERLSVEMRDGNPPDIFELEVFGDQLEEYVDEGNLLDLTDFLEESGLKDEFINLDAFTIDDKVYGLPFEGMVSGFYYNKEVLDELGGKPETWDDFISVIEAGVDEGYEPLLTQDMGMENMHFSSMFNILMERMAGGDIMNKLEEGEIEWTDDEMVSALEKFKALAETDAFTSSEEMAELQAEQDEMLEDGDMEDEEEMMDEIAEMQQKPYKQLLDGEALFVYDMSMASASPDEEEDADDMMGAMGGSPYGIVAMAEEEGKEDMVEDIGFMALPEMSDGEGDQSSLEAQMMGGYGFNGNVSDEEEEVIHKFIETFWSEESMERTAEDNGTIPARRIDHIASMDNPIQQEILDAIHDADSTFSDIFGGSMMESMLMEEIGNGLEKIAEDDESPENVAENLQKETENAIEQMGDMEW